MTPQSDLPATRQCVRCGCASRLVCERLVKSESEHRRPAPPHIGRFYQCADYGYVVRAA